METLKDIIIKAAYNLGILGDDLVTVNSARVTKAGLIAQANNILRYSIGQVLMNKYPQDFLQFTYPKNTYTKKFTVDSSSSGTNLVSANNDFSNGMEDQYIHNPATGEKLKIQTYITGFNVTLATAPAASWAGATCYVLGNEFPFTGKDLADLQSLVRVDVKYLSTDTEFQRAEFVDVTDYLQMESRFFTKSSPKFIEISINVAGQQLRGFKLLPDPTSYNGKYRLVYTQLPKPMINDSDIPQNLTMGIPLLLEYGITEWGAGLLGEIGLRDEYKGRYNELYAIQITNYKPRSKATQNQAWDRAWIEGLATRDI